MRMVEAVRATKTTAPNGLPAPVVALHGTAGSAKQWRQLAASLKGKRDVICPDVPGYGNAASVVAPVASMMDAEAGVVLQQIVELGQPVHLVGHSYGAALALKIAMRAPGLLASLTVIEPAMFHLLKQGDDNDQKLNRQITAIAGMISAAIAEGSPGAGMERFVDFWNGRGAYANSDPAMRAMLASQIGQVAANFATGMAQDWSIEDCRAISCPTMAIMGLQSRLVAQRTTEMVAEAIPDMQLAMISDAGHMSPFTHAGIVNRLIGGHITAAEAEGTNQPFLQAA